MCFVFSMVENNISSMMDSGNKVTTNTRRWDVYQRRMGCDIWETHMCIVYFNLWGCFGFDFIICGS